MRNWNIFGKILVFGLGIGLFTVLAFSLMLSGLFSRHFYREYAATLTQALEEAGNVTARYREGRIGGRAFGHSMQLIDRLEGVHFCLLDARGEVIFATDTDEDQMLDKDTLRTLAHEAQQGKITTRVLGIKKKPYTDVMVAATRDAGLTLIGFFPVADIREPINASLRMVWLAALGAIALAVVPAYFFSRHLTHPLREMSQLAFRMGRGDFGARIDVHRQDEVGQLAEALNRMACQLETLEKSRQDFLASISHELRTPLTSIRGFVQGMLDGTIPAEDRSVYLARVFAETGHLARIVDDLLTLARLKSGRLSFNWEELDPEAVLADVVEMLGPLAEGKRVTIDFQPTEGHALIRGDRCRLAQVFTNILDNAIKYTSRESKVTVRPGWQSRGFEVRIADQGPGIPPNDLPRIFEWFYTGSFSSEREHAGTGLGLAISKLLVEEHGGCIAVANRPQGGCEFTVFLPTSGPCPLEAVVSGVRRDGRR